MPRQRRARASMDFVLEAAAQVLEATGEAGFNTNAVAERAGVSIGTLYRYFPDKTAILRTLAARETETHRRTVKALLRDGHPGVARDRALIRAFLRAFSGRNQARRIAVSAMLAHADHQALAAKFAAMETGITDAQGRPLTPVQAFVLSRAVHGAMRTAVLEGADFLLSQEFEDELVRLGRAYLGYPTSGRVDGRGSRSAGRSLS
ncbi:TetR/AcrR family transcriptional regulator [uncultured Phenylobacterium sp.]|uniref:TetR/AcrR family transcriptional regulator n=1 Tax=uncultured Phenylobacterium sp. TaxID=349273 RepID=UPI0025E3CBA4|nr:TetR/AcrR family transcriptional regulator [uncultured Phenylobacterium sp.]